MSNENLIRAADLLEKYADKGFRSTVSLIVTTDPWLQVDTNTGRDLADLLRSIAWHDNLGMYVADAADSLASKIVKAFDDYT